VSDNPDESIPQLRPHPIIVGVAPGAPAVVLLEAARFAHELGTDLACVSVNSLQYPGEVFMDGSIAPMPVMPDLIDAEPNVFDPELADEINHVLADSTYVKSGSQPVLAVRLGDPSNALAHFAEQVDARAIVVGTRQPGFRSGFEEFLSGSVAARLAHRQPRPVIVVPVSPKPDAVPWVEGTWNDGSADGDAASGAGGR
jgi:nucleotide-binding universal stress UspA family protein